VSDSADGHSLPSANPHPSLLLFIFYVLLVSDRYERCPSHLGQYPEESCKSLVLKTAVSRGSLVYHAVYNTWSRKRSSKALGHNSHPRSYSHLPAAHLLTLLPPLISSFRRSSPRSSFHSESWIPIARLNRFLLSGRLPSVPSSSASSIAIRVAAK
jgi:hypothetical protein